mmetsp:Transcript_66404/g.130908  ORF Transcript_66404/g.130908 Transcript_66404/m.130908 type:complete len:193 (-) Transcript_66404:54-632(-)
MFITLPVPLGCASHGAMGRSRGGNMYSSVGVRKHFSQAANASLGGGCGGSKHSSSGPALLLQVVAASLAASAVRSAGVGLERRVQRTRRCLCTQATKEDSMVVHKSIVYGHEQEFPPSERVPGKLPTESVPGLRDWLWSRGLDRHFAAVDKWCLEMGAVDFGEVAEETEELAEFLGDALTEEERRVLLRFGY